MGAWNTLEFYCDREECGNLVESLDDKFCKECTDMPRGIDLGRDSYFDFLAKVDALWSDFIKEDGPDIEGLAARGKRWMAFLEARGEDPRESYLMKWPLPGEGQYEYRPSPGKCLYNEGFRRMQGGRMLAS